MNKEAIYDTRPWKVFGEGPIANADIKITPVSMKVLTLKPLHLKPFYSNQEISLCFSPCMAGRKASCHSIAGNGK